jgi:molybdate-binding protein
MNKLTNIDKEDRVFARKNPDLVNGYVDGTKTVDDVAQTIAQKMDDIQTDRKSLGTEYETIRAS